MYQVYCRSPMLLLGDALHETTLASQTLWWFHLGARTGYQCAVKRQQPKPDRNASPSTTRYLTAVKYMELTKKTGNGKGKLRFTG